MDRTESGIVLPAGVRVVAPAPPIAPWSGGEQMHSVSTPVFWLDLQRQVRLSGGELERFRRAVKRGV